MVGTFHKLYEIKFFRPVIKDERIILQKYTMITYLSCQQITHIKHNDLFEFNQQDCPVVSYINIKKDMRNDFIANYKMNNFLNECKKHCLCLNCSQNK
jgi:hypothetical protein